MKIELSPEILVYTGRGRGREDRKRFGLSKLDSTEGIVEVRVPQSVYTMTSSYFLELFGESIRMLGRHGFQAKYKIIAPDHVSRKVDDWMDRALREKKGLLGGDE